MNLPPSLVSLAEIVPPEAALRELTLPMAKTASDETVKRVRSLGLSPAAETLAWLYLGDLERAHDLCQAMPGQDGAVLHAVVHRLEGDFWNAMYWWRQAGQPDGEGAKLTKAVEAGDRSEETIARQRAEWSSLAARLAA